MKGSLTKNGRRCDVTVTKTHLTCVLSSSMRPDVTLKVPLEDILAVENPRGDGSAASTVLVHYAAHKKNKVLSWAKLVLSAEPELCRELKTIFSTTMADRLRPKHYLVVINPVSGSKNGRQLFHKKVAPLLRTCGATFKVYETKGKDDYDNAFKDVELSELDGVLAVGGDGHYSKVITACVRRHQASQGQDVNDPDLDLPPLPCPVGALPGGSGNFIPLYLHGTTDLMTAAIKVVLGKSMWSNIASVSQGGQVVGYSALILGYGLFGDMMEGCERARWMGNFRYKVVPLKVLLSRRLIPDIHVDVEREATPGQWDTVKDSLYSINTNIVNLEDNKTRLMPVFGDSALTINLTSQCALGDHMKQLSKVAAWNAGAYDYPFLQTERVLRYRIRLPNAPTTTRQESGEPLLTDNFFLNMDGEPVLINHPVCDIRLHKGVLKLFGESRAESRV